MSKRDNKKSTPIYLTEESKELLEKISREEERSMSGQVEFMIKNYYEKFRKF